MTISDKIKLFFITRKITHDEIAKLYGSTAQTIGNYVNGRREMPSEFFIWLKRNYPEIDFNKLFIESDSHQITNEKKNVEMKEEIKKEIEKVLDRFLQ